MAGTGPAGNPNAVRRNSRVGMVRLPAAGRKGRAPKWPLPENPRLGALIGLELDLIEELEERELEDGKLSKSDATKLTRARQRLAIKQAEVEAVRETETELWKELWRTPQACEWERLKWTREVAQYVRHKAAAEIGSLDDSKEARLRGEALGLSPTGLRKLMWVISHDEVKERRQEKKAEQAATGTDGPTSRRHLMAVEED